MLVFNFIKYYWNSSAKLAAFLELIMNAKEKYVFFKELFAKSSFFIIRPALKKVNFIE
jgi:hypothetical protein